MRTSVIGETTLLPPPVKKRRERVAHTSHTSSGVLVVYSLHHGGVVPLPANTQHGTKHRRLSNLDCLRPRAMHGDSIVHVRQRIPLLGDDGEGADGLGIHQRIR